MIRRDAVRRLILGSIAATTLACSSGDLASDQLSGYWSNDNVHLSANDQGATFTEACLTAQFAPITPDSAGAFSVVSASLVETGNTIHYPDDVLHMNGQRQNGALTLTLYITRSEPPVSDPVALTLTPGGSHDVPICRA